MPWPVLIFDRHAALEPVACALGIGVCFQLAQLVAKAHIAVPSGCQCELCTCRQAAGGVLKADIVGRAGKVQYAALRTQPDALALGYRRRAFTEGGAGE